MWSLWNEFYAKAHVSLKDPSDAGEETDEEDVGSLLVAKFMEMLSDEVGVSAFFWQVHTFRQFIISCARCGWDSQNVLDARCSAKPRSVPCGCCKALVVSSFATLIFIKIVDTSARFCVNLAYKLTPHISGRGDSSGCGLLADSGSCIPSDFVTGRDVPTNPVVVWSCHTKRAFCHESNQRIPQRVPLHVQVGWFDRGVSVNDCLGQVWLYFTVLVA